MSDSRQVGPATSLIEIQRWMLSAIQCPERTSVESVNKMVKATARDGLSSEQRLAIYQQGYTSRLLECMRSEYPLLIGAFSTEWFDMMAQRYLARHPPTSTNLNNLCAEFPRFLAQDRPDKEQETQDSVYDFLVGIAQFERCKIETSRGKGAEEVGFDEIILLDTHALEALHITVADNLRLLIVPFDLISYLASHKNSEQDHLLSSRSQTVMLSRYQYRLMYSEIESWQFELIDSLRGGLSVADSLATTQLAHPDLAIYGLAPFFLAQLAAKGGISKVSPIE